MSVDKVIVTKSYLDGACDAIRRQLGVEDTYYPSEFEDAIDSITGAINASSIAIITQPTKLSYTDGEAIDVGGMVVKGFDGNGDEIGVIPNNSLSLNPAVAHYTGSGEEEEEEEESIYYTIDSDTNLPDWISAPVECFIGDDIVIIYEYAASTKAYHFYTDSDVMLTNVVYISGSLASQNRFMVLLVAASESSFQYKSGSATDWTTATSATKNGHTYYYGYSSLNKNSANEFIEGSLANIIYNAFNVSGVPDLAYASLFDSEGGGSEAGSETVTVSYTNPISEAVLTDTFDITVLKGGYGLRGEGSYEFNWATYQDSYISWPVTAEEEDET